MGSRFIKSLRILTGSGINIVHKLIIATFITLMAGPAIADQSVNFLYHPAAKGKGGSGDIYLAQRIQPVSGRPSVEWIIGNIKNGSGVKTGNIVSGRPPVDTLMEAFSLELKAAGYNVIPVEALPDGVVKGIRLAMVSVSLDEIDRIYKVETKCNVKVSLELWRSGKEIKKLDYESSYEDSTFLDRDMILIKSEQMALEQLMARAVREAIQLIEQK